MKILKTFLLLLVMVCAGNSYGQTKEETEQWLSETFKLIEREYTIKTSDPLDDTKCKNIGFVLKDGKLSVTSYLSFHIKGELSYKNMYKVIDIPVNKIREMEARSGEYSFGERSLAIDMEPGYYNIQLEETNVDITGSKSSSESLDYFKFYIPDESLGNRIIKALEHYKTFYPKKKETF